jgi:DNA modification methylase
MKRKAMGIEKDKEYYESAQGMLQTMRLELIVVEEGEEENVTVVNENR